MKRRELLSGAAVGWSLAQTIVQTAQAAPDERGDADQPVQAARPVDAAAKPRLPFAADALAPKLSADTVRSHFAGYHIAYYQRLLNVEDQRTNALSLTEVIRQCAGVAATRPLYVAASQLFNHNMYWNSLRAGQEEAPPDVLVARASRDFGGIKGLQDALLAAASEHLEPGWLWLLADQRGRLSVRVLADDVSPLSMGLHPLLAVDLWEHAYYLDYRHRRSAYLSAVLDLLNWRFATSMLLASVSGTSRA